MISSVGWQAFLRLVVRAVAIVFGLIVLLGVAYLIHSGRLFPGFFGREDSPPALLEASCVEGCRRVELSPAEEDRPSPFCRVSRWGPRETAFGERFNEQRGGLSAFWVKTECAPENVRLVLGDRPLTTSWSIPAVTATFNADLHIRMSGVHELFLFDPDSGLAIPVGEFRVYPGPGPSEDPASEDPAPTAAETPHRPPVIAHAAGAYMNQAYMNSLDALTFSYALGHRIFEVDFSWTRDQELVGIHDWEISFRGLFPGADHERIPDLAGFKALNMYRAQTQITVPRLKKWLQAHPDAWLIPDIKGHPLPGLHKLREGLGSQHRQVMPVITRIEQYDDVRAMGFEQISFLIHTIRMSPEQLSAFLAHTELFSVILNTNTIEVESLLPLLKDAGVFVYVHTINSLEKYDYYREIGVDGVLSDFLFVDDSGHLVAQ